MRSRRRRIVSYILRSAFAAIGKRAGGDHPSCHTLPQLDMLLRKSRLALEKGEEGARITPHRSAPSQKTQQCRLELALSIVTLFVATTIHPDVSLILRLFDKGVRGTAGATHTRRPTCYTSALRKLGLRCSVQRSADRKCRDRARQLLLEQVLAPHPSLMQNKEMNPLQLQQPHGRIEPIQLHDPWPVPC